MNREILYPGQDTRDLIHMFILCPIVILINYCVHSQLFVFSEEYTYYEINHVEYWLKRRVQLYKTYSSKN